MNMKTLVWVGGVCLQGLVAGANPAASAGFENRDATVYAWRGEKQVVWRDLTNRAASAVLVRPTCEQAFVRVGVARPVRGDNDILYADRVDWGGAALVETGAVVRLVAEIAVPRTGSLPAAVSVKSPLGSVDCPLAVCERQFPEGSARRTFLDLWQHPWAVARYYRVKPFSKAHYAKMRPLWTRLAEAGQKVVTATIMNRPWAHQCFDGYGSMVRHIKRADGSWQFDYAVFDEYVKFALDCGLGPQIHCYSVCPFRLKRYYWEDEKGRTQFGDFDVGSSEYLAYWEPFLKDFAQHLKAKGLFDQTYIALDERSPDELRTAYDLVKRCGGFKIAMAGDRRPEQFEGVEIDNFTIALQCVTPDYIASARARRAAGKTTTVYVAGGNPCTGTAQPLVDCQWLGAYPGAVDLDGFLRWAYCSWPANPNSDSTYDPWFGHWSAGGTYLAYPSGPSMRCLALFNGLNLSEKLKILRDEGKIDAELAAALREFEYKGAKAYASYPAQAVLRKTEALVHARSAAAPASPRERTQFKGLHAGAVRPAEHVRGFLWLEAENFESYGDWEIDTQFTHKMGSAYLICPGLAVPRTNPAHTTVTVPRPGVWHVWARTKDWVPEHSPGKFALEVAGRRSSTLGASGKAGWRWEKAMACELVAGDVALSLVDLSGAFARCDAVLLTQEAAYVPPEEETALLNERLRLTGCGEAVAEAGAYDFVVVGAGAGGMGAAVAAARSGAKVALVYDRPVPGGNGSREMGIGLDGAQMSRKGSREAGLAEEFRMRAARHQNVLGFAYEDVLDEMGDAIATFPNERVMRVEKEGRRIVAVLARNTLTGKWSRYRAKLFADATGDGWVAHFAGARTMYGREDKKAFGEDWTVDAADRLTMSGTIMGGCMGMRVRWLPKGEKRAPYHAPAWAKVLPRPFWRPQKHPGSDWWMENPGRLDDLDDPEGARDNLIRIAFDYWDWQCNEWEQKSLTERVVLDHVPYHNARREGMRVVGDYVLTGNDCVTEKVFPDAVATGGWSCDVHDPLGMENPKSDGWNLVHKGGPGPYTVPYRMLYSADIDNLFLASRCFSMSHIALGSMRVGGSIMSAAQAVGTAAAFCLKRGLLPREYGQRHLDELRHRLFRDDVNIQWLADDDPDNLARSARASDPGLNDGIGVPMWKNRKEPEDYHGWKSEEKTALLEWNAPVRLSEVRLAFDTGLKTRRVALPMPAELVRDYTLEVCVDGNWRQVAQVRDNGLRHRIHAFPTVTASAVRVTVERTWGDAFSRILEIRAYEDALVAPATGPLDALLPRPRQVTAGAGTADAAALGRVRTLRGVVAGAPAAVADEAYVLEITPQGVQITASDVRGERWARVTLEQLRTLSHDRVPCCRIVDWPALKWRGFMNDCGRNYLDFAAVKACVDTMAKYKMNLFHWHLSDYHGWRLESKKYPQLQRKEAFLRQVGKYYTQDEFRELVAYAAERGVTVMPEFDVPGHSLALRRGLGIETMAAPGTDKIVDDLFVELCGLAPADVMPFVHLGTDEVRVKPEYCDDAWVSKWARTVNRLGRKAVVWAPGKRLDKDIDVIDMAWHDDRITNSVNRAFDAARMYNGGWCPFAVAPRAAFTKACRWPDATGRQIGAITCTWHDDNCGDDNTRLFRDCMVLPSIVAFADNYWSGRKADHPERWQRLPPPGDPLLVELADLERRLAVHRDAFFAGYPYPFPFLRQTQMRWRLTDEKGTVLAEAAPQAWFGLNAEGGAPGFTTNRTGCVTAEAWIESPADIACGAWIDFTCFGAAYGRTSPTPDLGEWNKHGAKVYLNGVEIRPPRWIQPNMKATTKRINDQDVPWTDDLLDKPFADEGCARREPTPIVLKRGVNVVKLVMPKKPGSSKWVGLFSPLLGTSAHPREVPGLVWRSPR